MEPRKQAIIDALSAFMNQRSGIEYADYGDVKAFRAEQRSITKDLRQARVLMDAVKWRDGITADDLLAASVGAFSGRLTIKVERISGALLPPHVGRDWTCHCGLYANPESPCYNANAVHIDDCPMRAKWRVSVDYCTGQYFPTEYRRAVCAVLASALWEYTREKEMPAPAGYVAQSWARLGESRVRGNLRSTRTEADADVEANGGREWGSVTEVYGQGRLSAGDWLRAHFRKEFGRGIAARWFS